MGDCLLLTGPVRALKKEFPNFRISVLVESRFAACFDGNPDLDTVISVRHKFAAGARLLGLGFDAIVNLHGGPTSLIYSCLARGPRIGASHFRYSRLYWGLIPQPDRGLHTAEATMSMFRWLGVQSEEIPPLRYEPHAAEAERMRLMILKGGPYAILHPGSITATKRWESGRFASVARMLLKSGINVVVTCGPGEEIIAGEIATEVPDVTILLGLTIPELAESIRGAQLYLGNDSGPMHLAAAVGTPVVAVWGSSDSSKWRPWRVKHRIVQNLFECNPCPGYRCLVAETPLCIESVSVEQVSHSALELLK